MGWSEIRNPDGSVLIQETYTCGHCNGIRDAVFRVEPFLCRACMKRICERCARGLAAGQCVPFERKLGMYERRVAEILGQDGIEGAVQRHEARGALYRAVGLLE